jgi:type I restriction enzyme R subunit
MSPDISERRFEEDIERVLLRGGYDAYPTAAGGSREGKPPFGESPPGGYRKRKPEDYDRELCLIPQDAYDFILATQPKEWGRYQAQQGSAAKAKLLERLSSEIGRKGSLVVLRSGFKDMGVLFRLAFFRPASGLNAELARLYQANIFSIVRQLHYSPRGEQSLDLAIFINGLPLFTVELKNPMTGQGVEDAIAQYKRDRDQRESLLAYGRCLAHFAVDPNLVYVSSQLAGEGTRFLPFNKGRFGGAGNPPVSPTRVGYPTSYLWEETWARDSVLELLRQFIQEVEEEDDRGRRTGKRFILFPRYQQLDCVRALVADARERGPGRKYLIQHSAGSGKSYTIAWLAHQLSTLHDVRDQRVFDSIVVVTDRRQLDRQLQSTVRQFEQTLGVVENIDTTSRQLKAALEDGKTIIVTTLQKFPVIAKEIGELPGKRFALIVDKAHSSQSGESTKSLKAVLTSRGLCEANLEEASLEEAEAEEAHARSPEEELDEKVQEEIAKRGSSPNLSTFAFTATPKSKTFELFGNKLPDGSYAPFHLYSMRQAIEEGFILDVLSSYTTYTSYWKLLKKIEADPRYEKKKAEYLLKAFVDLSDHAIKAKLRVMVEHFAVRAQAEIGGRAKAMIVTRSRLHAVRYKLAIDKYLESSGYPFKALVAFSGAVKDGGKDYSESGMNGFPEAQTAKTFEKPEYRFLIVANKFQTGFDQPLLHTMYVDKKLGGVGAVQTLSRLNRTHPEKKGTMVLDFANEAEEIKLAFEPYFESTILEEGTDPNLLYELEDDLLGFPVFDGSDVETFARAYFLQNATLDRLYAAQAAALARYAALEREERDAFKSRLTDYVRLYSFLAQILPFADPSLEKLYVYARHLRRQIKDEDSILPIEVQRNIDMESYRLQRMGERKIALDRRPGILVPQTTKEPIGMVPDELEALSRIIAELNERFGLNLGPEHRLTIGQMMERLDGDPALEAASRVNTRENVRLTFDQKVEDVIQEIVDSNFELYKRITDDQAFGEVVKSYLFDQYLRSHRNAQELIKQGESKTLEFKSTLRWNLVEEKKDDEGITHAVLKTIAAFLNTEGGDLLIGVADDKSIVGMEPDRFESEDKFMLHLAQCVRNGLGDRAGTCIDPRVQQVGGKAICAVACQRSPEPVYLRWKRLHKNPEGDFYVRSGLGSVRLGPESALEFIRSRFPRRNASSQGD